MERQLIEKVIDEAKDGGANLVVWDRRDTFTVEAEDVKEIETNDDHLRIMMQDGRAIVYVEYDYIYKLVVEKDRSVRAGIRAGFGAAGSESARYALRAPLVSLAAAPPCQHASACGLASSISASCWTG
jgi:hypothetical protein